MLRLTILFSVIFSLATPASLRAIEAVAVPPLKFVSKPANTGPDRRARLQPTIPENYSEIPFTETAPEPKLTAQDKQRGYLLFQRPIMDPVYPNTRPFSHERLDSLTAFATPGEFEPVTFSVYPERGLENFRVRVSSLSGPGGEIDASQVTARLLAYWNVGFPRYTSRDTYRRLPELLERVTVHSSPARECQRWWIQIHVPEDAKPGLYKGKVTVWDDGFDRATEIPLALRVLGFKLKSDPAKHYSAYYYVRNNVQFSGKDEAFIRKATGNEYRAMIEYGLDMLPTFYLATDDQGEKITVRYAEELDRMLAAGMKGPLPVAGDNAIDRIYRDTTPGGKRASHWQIDKMPPPEFYEKVTALFKAFDVERRVKGWPEVVCCPLDEVASSHQEFGSRVYQAVRKAGVRTYATKDPLASDAAPYRPYIDVWCSQPYSEPYERIVAQDRYEYWSYPNHNGGEIKDRRVMCKGGRMTYGFGFWRSGYTTLIPWHWAWTPAPDQFDYLRGSHSGCGQRIDENGEVIPAVYWECFREGRDDARYIYTLQQAVWERDGASDPQCRRLVEEGKALLRETWDDIAVQQKYLAAGMWPSEEFNARRWRLGVTIDALIKHPATRTGVAPSVIVDALSPKTVPETPSIIDRSLQQGKMESRDLGGDFGAWHNGTKEGSVELTSAAGQDGKKGLRWRVKIDHETDGGEGGQYPVGWPRVARSFGERELDMSAYDYLQFTIRVDSDRDEVTGASTPLGLQVSSHGKTRQFFVTTHDFGDRQRVWIPIRLPVKEMMETAGMGPDPWKTVSLVQIFVAEQNYNHGSNLTFDLGEVKLLRFISPVISGLATPSFVMLPRSTLPIALEVAGPDSVRPGVYWVKASLTDGQGGICSRTRQDLNSAQPLALDTSTLMPGCYTLKVEITGPGGETCSESTGTFEGVAGPLHEANHSISNGAVKSL